MKAIQKILLITCILLMCLSLGSCSMMKPKTDDVTPSKDVVQTQEPSTEKPSEEPSTEEPSVEPIGGDPMSLPPFTYEIEDGVWEEEGIIDVTYPVLVNTNNEERADLINEAIGADMYNLIDGFLSLAEDPASMTIESTYEYTDSIWPAISISYLGSYYAEAAAYPVSFFHTITINLNTAEVVPLSDFFVIDDTFVEAFMMGTYAPLIKGLDLEESGAAVSDIISEQYSYEELADFFSQAEATFYMTEIGVILSIEMPHALGDHLEMAVKYEYIETNIITDNPFWSDYTFIIPQN